MKRTAIVAALTFVMVFALGGVAMAFDWPTDVPPQVAPENYYGGWGGASPTSYYNTGEAAGGFKRENPVYVRWVDVLDTYNGGAGTEKGTAQFNSGEFNTPHKGYGTTTTLCAVCHSVHWAPVYDGNTRVSYGDAQAAVGTAGYAEKLLRTSGGNSCNYCHIETSIGGIQIYAGDTSLYGTAQNFTSSFAHDFHGDPDEGCLVCHSVHGANTFGGAVGGKILLQEPRGRAPQPETIDALTNSLDPATGVANVTAPMYATLADAYDGTDRFEQQVVFCTSCHYVYSDDASKAHAYRGGTTWVKSHPMVEASATAGIAFAGSGTCRSCHDAGGVDQNTADRTGLGAAIDNIPASGYSSNNFPHYTAGNYRFLDQDGLGMENAIDKSCIKCHQQGVSGVGLTF